MINKKIIVKNNVDIVVYSAAVQDIVDKFFDDENNYTPQFGRANAVGVFFNYFVDTESFDNYFANTDKKINIDFLLANADCMKIYNKALECDGKYNLNFANAYTDAIEIVKQKNASFGTVIDNIKNAVTFISDKISPAFSGDNIIKLSEIAKEVSNGKLNAESIIEAYGNSQRLKDISKKD